MSEAEAAGITPKVFHDKVRCCGSWLQLIDLRDFTPDMLSPGAKHAFLLATYGMVGTLYNADMSVPHRAYRVYRRTTPRR